MAHKKRWEKYKGSKSQKKENKEWYKAIRSTYNCLACGENDDAVLEFHHRDPKEKEGTISGMVRSGVPLKKVREEAAKCDIVCSNCHKIIHKTMSFFAKDENKDKIKDSGTVYLPFTL